MNNTLRLISGGLVAALLSVIASAADLAPAPFSAGRVTGDATYKVAGTDTYLALTSGTALPQGATIKTGAGSSAEIVFASGSVAVVDESSEIEVTKFEQAMFSGAVSGSEEPAVSNTELKVIDGGVASKVSKLMKGSAYTVNTPVGAAGVRGTVFKVTFNRANGTFSVATVEGAVVFTSTAGTSVRVTAGQLLTALGVTDLPKSEQAKILAVFVIAVGKSILSGGQTVTTPDFDISVSVD